MLVSAGLSQHISEPTHESGHILDLVITRASERMVKETLSDLLSDHLTIGVRLKFSKPHQTGKRVTFRKLCCTNQQMLRKDIMDSALGKGSVTSLDDLTECYDSVLRKLLERHAPLISCIFPIKNKLPRCSKVIAEVKQECAKCERHWRRTRLTIHRDIFKIQRLRVSNIIKSAKREYYLNILSTNSDHKVLYNIFRQMTSGNRDQTLPSHTSVPDTTRV